MFENLLNYIGVCNYMKYTIFSIRVGVDILNYEM